ncbi:glycogen-binding subunit 76A isoform X2 [Diabrotica virgifera virgifera]|uniref:CBM21 domain-containing protein n=1 Tax=Diabrotica virgifera virgifera TaxID=50390 RepID=A0ABM5KRE6_DIAVI|nr:glycogen-binding subunit 76A isoform X2 [Diabrotica virgifera virgifera]
MRKPADSMTSEGERCGGLGSFLAMSCRGRAEAFARRLHSKLRSLGSQDENGSADESSWLAAHENPITISQPAHSANAEQFLDLDILESPGSPEEEIDEVDLNKLMNKDTLQSSCTKDSDKSTLTSIAQQSAVIAATTNSNDSDSEQFYDTEDERLLNHVNGIEDSEEKSDTYLSSQDFSSTSEFTGATISEDASMLSFKQEDLSLDVDSSLTDISKCNGDISPPCDKSSVKIVVSDENSVNIDSGNSYESKEPQLLMEQVKDDVEELEEKQPRVKRSTSLKTGKTPPGTPGQKKYVRFADALGLDLADVRTFMDEIPKIPTSAYEDLVNADLSDSSSDSNLSTLLSRVELKPQKYLLPMFQQPASLPNFLDLVREYNVCLENVYVDDPILLSLKGTVRVRNLDFHKSVYIRYSLDSWDTFADIQATYVDNSCDGFSDKFTFLLYAHTLSIGQKLQLACRFQCRGCQFWDNNKGVNYCFQCLPASHPSTPGTSMIPQPHDDWGGASFY